MEALSLLGMLGFCSIEDVRSKRINIIVALLFGILGVYFHLHLNRLSVFEMIGGVLVGVGLYMISVLSGESIGKGDAVLMVVVGIYMGFWYSLVLLWAASMMVGVAGIFAATIMGKGRKFEIPFTPFLLIVYIIFLVINDGSIAC